MRQITAVIKNKDGKNANPDDLTLARAASKGDTPAVNKLINRVIDRVQKTISYLANGSEDAKDLVQLALVQIVRSVGTFRGDCAIEYWADRIAVQTAAKHFERKKRRKKLREAVWHPPSVFYDMEEEIALLQVRRKLAEVIGTLPAKQRIPLVLFYLHGYEIAQIAEMTGAKINTVRGRLRYGRSRIRKKVLADPTLKRWVQGETI